MGDGDKTPLRLQFNPKVLEFHGATIVRCRTAHSRAG